MMKLRLLPGLLLLICWPTGAPAGTPADAIDAALADLSRLPATEHASIRYLSLQHLPADERAETVAVLSFVLNSVSRTETIEVPTTDTSGELLRVNLADYELPAAVWEQLASQDPYWHQRVTVLAGTTKQETFTDGGWVGLGQAARLRALTGSAGAGLRADFFLVRATGTLNGGVYYQLAGIPTKEAEFFQALGLETRTIDKLSADGGANLIRSRVTHKVRRVVRRPGPLGGAWHTYDVAQSSPERDPLRNPFAFEFDASEHIAAKRNGLHLFALYDRNGQRQNSVPDVIAKDSSDPHGAGIILPMISCVRCHVEEGLRPFVNDQQRLLQGPVELFVEPRANARRLAAFYQSDLGKQLRRDQEDYTTAVAAATGGRSVAETASALARIVAEYQEQLVTPAQAARELGVELPTLQAALTVSQDPMLLALSNGISVQREQWETVFGQAALLTNQGTAE